MSKCQMFFALFVTRNRHISWVKYKCKSCQVSKVFSKTNLPRVWRCFVVFPARHVFVPFLYSFPPLLGSDSDAPYIYIYFQLSNIKLPTLYCPRISYNVSVPVHDVTCISCCFTSLVYQMYQVYYVRQASSVIDNERI